MKQQIQYTLVVVFFILLVAAAFIVGRNSSRTVVVEPVSLDSNDPYTTTFAPKTPPTKSVSETLPQPAIPTSNTIPTSEQQSTPSSRTCTSNDIEGSSYVQNNGSTIIGTLSFKVRSGISCVLKGFPTIQIMDTLGTLPTINKKGSTSNSVQLKEGTISYIRALWSNWCERTLGSNISYKVQFENDTGYILIPAQLPNGSSLTAAPTCVSPQASSDIVVHSFVSSTL